MNRNITWILVLISCLMILVVVNSGLTDTNLDLKIDLVVTADLHADPMGYDYLADREYPKGGISRVSALLNRLRSESGGLFLLDLGGAYSGNFLLNYAVDRQKALEISIPKHPVLRAVEHLKYNGLGLSYHELSYGMKTLKELESAQGVPFFSANIYQRETGERAFLPYLVLERGFRGARRAPPLKIGVVGLISSENSASNSAEFVTNDMLSEMRKIGANLEEEGLTILALNVHLGVWDELNIDAIKEQVTPLTTLPGVNLIVVGFDVPSGHDGFSDIINGVHVTAVPTLGLGVATAAFKVSYDGRNWTLFNETSGVEQSTQRDATFDKILERDHSAIREVGERVIANLERTMTNDFAMIEDSEVESLLNEAQINYMRSNMPQNKEGMTVISLSPPFLYDAGTSGGSVRLPAGRVKINDLINFYQMAGTLVALQVTGKDVRDYLEWVSQAYIRTKEEETNPQYFINRQFPTSQFAMIDGLSYQVDIRQPSRYRGMQVVVPNARRIVNLRQGESLVRDADQFLLVANGVWLKSHPFFAPIIRSGTFFDTNIDVRSTILRYFDKYDTVAEGLVGNWKLVAHPEAVLHFLGSAEATPEIVNTRYIQFIRRSGPSGGIYQYDPNLQK
ncbi:MAG: 5'-nucleotidase C-terminal domain-containing protein [Spirochaetia bacterium]